MTPQRGAICVVEIHSNAHRLPMELWACLSLRATASPWCGKVPAMVHAAVFYTSCCACKRSCCSPHLADKVFDGVDNILASWCGVFSHQALRIDQRNVANVANCCQHRIARIGPRLFKQHQKIYRNIIWSFKAAFGFTNKRGPAVVKGRCQAVTLLKDSISNTYCVIPT